MNELKLSKRLEEVAKSIPKGAMIADIGSDHAYLPCYAYLQGYIKGAIAGEITEGPFQSAVKQVEKTSLTDVIEVRKGDGLAVITPGEVDCITIAGMGGTLIQTILEDGKEKLQGVKRLVLQPNIGAHHIRQWLIEHKWSLVDEKIMEDDGRIYEILVAEQGDPLGAYGDKVEEGILVGPILAREKNDAFKKKWNHELAHTKKIVEQMEKSATTKEGQEKKKKLENEIRIIEEVLS
ncbi:tRNA (adenine(22)-N(1))-methyltransferase TrmK [Priestia aryabhattai]|uniref:tRNA (adenine(22)-N(1))-methyltransferase n=1 Tax=Bacillaceae TaxID=186817 RepID=UPI000BA06F3F|nr:MULTISPECIES: tRNA (adenine(22)-N(1))-methyltransferase TrmK [Bacillaceae]MDT2045436.1 tRNA (adenine(22)-N(1))-methyltransferase TrmK [Priestia flexa]OZT13502.1 tRNA (adenine(22)-N(1))-methyltransferase TrmK [Priestia aryabhattai]TDB50810.1 tRNA (adenine-N(1))-methyltransferase [Bacillus sp. CBEL-1]